MPEENDIIELLSNPGESEDSPLESVSLTDPEARRASILDMSQRLTNKTAVKDRTKIPEQVEGFMQRANNFIGDPNVINALAQFGQAFAQGRPDEPGTILGQFAQNQVSSNAERNLLSRLLAGEKLEDIDLTEFVGLTPEAMTRAEQIAAGRRGEEREDTRLELGADELALRERALGLQEQGLNLQRFGVFLENEKFELTKEETERRLALAEKSAVTEQRVNESLISWRKTQETIAEGEFERSTEDNQATVLRERGRLIESLQDHEENLITQRRILESTLKGVEAAIIKEESGFFTSPSRDEIESDLEYVQAKGQLKLIEEELARHKTAVSELIEAQQADIKSGVTQTTTTERSQATDRVSTADVDENRIILEATEEDIASYEGEAVVATSIEELNRLERSSAPGTIISFRGRTFVASGDESDIEE